MSTAASAATFNLADTVLGTGTECAGSFVSCE
ncbi:MAG: hypothetical protein HLUCCA08_12325 [Rhodobacteraceae bacterium HLUCCA08]|nr:MAG: hypothetical protein HLUCCA08_12325 [Rhodobacteraceae bacterium HLUCCA08]